MSKRFYWTAVMMVMCAAGFVPAALAADNGAVGIWQGKLALSGGISLRLVVHIVKKGDGLAGTMDSVDQEANGIAIDSVLFEKSKLTFGVPSIGGTFEGTMNAAGTELTGVWKRRHRTAAAPQARRQAPGHEAATGPGKAVPLR